MIKANTFLRLLPLLLLPPPGIVMAQDAGDKVTQIERGRMPTECAHPGIRRVRTYDISSADIPNAFEGFRILFVADTHYPSLFTDETLRSLRAIQDEVAADMMLLGGDYQESCDSVAPLFSTMMRTPPPYGTFAVLGNNDLERCTDIIKDAMREHGITLVEDTAIQIVKGHSHITIAGVHNDFSLHEMGASPTLQLPPSEFVILLTHTPDYAEDQDISNADLTLAGHTHGGQVTLLGAFAPQTASHYGQRFLKGLNYNTAGQPVITTTGIGTSRRAIRLFAPSEVIVLTLHSWKRGERLPDPAVGDPVPMPLSKPLTLVRREAEQSALELPHRL